MINKFLTYYQLLEIKQSASCAEIECAFKVAAKKFHPDIQGNNESSTRLFQYFIDARNILLNAEQRRLYDSAIGLNSVSNTPKLSTQTNQYNGGSFLLIGLLGIWIGSELYVVRPKCTKTSFI